jgi:hypothetical protein
MMDLAEVGEAGYGLGERGGDMGPPEMLRRARSFEYVDSKSLGTAQSQSRVGRR